jgi:hypothetical protein
MIKRLICFSIVFIFIAFHYNGYAQLSGVLTIGNNPNNTYTFNSINSAFDSLKKVGVSGSLVLKIDSGFYNEKIIMGPIPNSSSWNNVIIESLSGDSSDVVIFNNLQNAQESVILIDSIKHLTIKNLTIRAESVNGTTGLKCIIQINPSTDSIRILNNQIIANLNTGDSLIGIINACNYYSEITNNLIANGLISILNNNNSYLPIYSKIVGNQLVNFREIGINGTRNSVLFGNLILSNIGYCGIASIGPGYIGNNKIINTQIAIDAIDNSVTYIYNNMVIIDRPSTKNCFLSFSIMSNSILVNNTVHIISGLNSSSLISGGYCPFNMAKSRLYNNILVNKVGSVFDIEQLSAVQMENNILYWNSTDIAKINNPKIDYHTLSDMAKLNVCINDLDSLPLFCSNTDLHLKFNQFEGFATVNTPTFNPPIGIPGIEYDIDDDQRNMTYFCPGADVFIPDSLDIMPYSFISPKQIFHFPYADSLKLVVLNSGLTPVTNYNLKIYLSGNLFGQITLQKALQPNQSDTINVGYFNFPSQNFDIVAITNHASDSKPQNDTLRQTSINQLVDLSMEAILFPMDSITTPVSFNYQVIVRNLGNTPISELPIGFKFGSQSLNDTFHQKLYPTDTIVLTSSKMIQPTNYDTLICAYTTHNLDFNHSNDSTCKLIDNISSIENTSSLSHLEINAYPNPTNDKVYFEFNAAFPKNTSIEIYNIIGQKIMSHQYGENKEIKTIEINLQTQSSGVYFYRVSFDKKVLFNGKIIKS